MKEFLHVFCTVVDFQTTLLA